MPEITLSGMNGITYPQIDTWGWQVATYLFLGGLVAGLMVLGSLLRLLRRQRYARAVLAGDLAALPLLGIGMLLLFLDLANPLNVWRLFVTLQLTSPMSWGSWILLFSMLVLVLRLALRFAEWPAPSAVPPNSKRNGREGWRRSAQRAWRDTWQKIAATSRRFAPLDRPLSVLTLLLGLCVGIYTGVLLSSIASRPLWNSGLLPALFLASGLGSGAAFLSVFARKEEQPRLVPLSIGLGLLELMLAGAYLLSLHFGTTAMQRSAALVFSGPYGLMFCGIVIFVGLCVPVLVEIFEWRGEPLPGISTTVTSVLTLTGGVTLRFVIVLAGMLSFI
jgi:formate-dependent nitrite reductase membrane component NrfD